MKVTLGKATNLYQRLMVSAGLIMAGQAVQAQTYYSGNSGAAMLNYANQAAGNRTMSNFFANAGDTTSQGVNFLLVIFTAMGIGLVGFSLYGLYKASKDERETPKSAIWGLVIGGTLTAVTTIAFFLRNTVTS
jgi:hypothetical protein